MCWNNFFLPWLVYWFFFFFSYAISKNAIVEEVISVMELHFSDEVWHSVSYSGNNEWRNSIASYLFLLNPFFSYCFLGEREREREKLCSNGISERIPQALPSPPTPFLSLLMYDFKLCQRFSQRHPSCFTFLYKGANPTPHPSRQDIGFFLVGRCCSQCVIPGGYFRFLVLLSVLSGGNRWSVFEILNPF